MRLEKDFVFVAFPFRFPLPDELGISIPQSSKNSLHAVLRGEPGFRIGLVEVGGHIGPHYL